MDERTRRPDGPIEAEFRPAAPPSAPTREKRRTGVRLVLRIILRLAFLIALLVACYLLVRLLSPPHPARNVATNADTAPQPVAAATIGRGDIRVTVNALGTVTPIATVTVQSQINGQLQEVAFTEGQMVKKGDFLAQVDSRPYQLLQAQYEGQLAHDQGVLAQARIDLTRYKSLAASKSIPQQQYEDQIYIVQQDEGTVKLDQALIDQQKLNVAYCHIVAPITGRIGLRLVDPGNYVQTTNNTGIAVIAQVQPITVIFPVPEDDLREVLPQMNAGTPLEVQVYDRANVHLLATGQAASLDSQIDTTTGMVKLRARFDNADQALFPNQFVNVELVVKTLHGAITVPTPAIQRGAPGTYVYVINADDTVSVRPIAIGPIDGPAAAVTSGLSVGDRVVVDGADHLRDGAHVAVSAASPRSPANAIPAPNTPSPAPQPADRGPGDRAGPGASGSH